MNADTSHEEHKTKSLDEKSLVKVDTQMMPTEDITKEELDAKILSLMEKVENGINSWRCSVCVKTSKTKRDIKRHIETHLDGLSYKCYQCGKVSMSSNGLQAHISKDHKL